LSPKIYSQWLRVLNVCFCFLRWRGDVSNVRQYFWLWHLNSFSIINKKMPWRCEVQLRDCANVTLKVGSFAHGVHGVKLLIHV